MNNIFTNPIIAIQAVCTELGLSHTTYTINHEDIDVSATIMTDGTNKIDDTIVFIANDSLHSDWIYIVRNEYYLRLNGGPEGQTLYFCPILRGTMDIPLSWADKVSAGGREINDLIRALELSKKSKKDWYAIAWGNDHMPTTMQQKSVIEKRLERHRLGFYPSPVDKVKINADIEFDEEGHVTATTVMELDRFEVQKLRELDCVWHVEPVAEPKPSVEVFPLSAEIDGIDEDYRLWLGENNHWTHAVPFEDSWCEGDWESVKAYYGFTEYNVDRTYACENGACIWFR